MAHLISKDILDLALSIPETIPEIPISVSIKSKTAGQASGVLMPGDLVTVKQGGIKMMYSVKAETALASYLNAMGWKDAEKILQSDLTPIQILKDFQPPRPAAVGLFTTPPRRFYCWVVEGRRKVYDFLNGDPTGWDEWKPVSRFTCLWRAQHRSRFGAEREVRRIQNDKRHIYPRADELRVRSMYLGYELPAGADRTRQWYEPLPEPDQPATWKKEHLKSKKL